MEIAFTNEACHCQPDECKHYCDPPSECINRVTGKVGTAHCEHCEASTWHQDGKCLRCK